MLIVIAIISVLIALLMPSLSRVRGMAESVRCQSNLRQSGVAMLVRAGEHRGEIGLVAYFNEANSSVEWLRYLTDRAGTDYRRGTGSGMYLTSWNASLCPVFEPHVNDGSSPHNRIYGALMLPAGVTDTGSFVPPGGSSWARIAQLSRIGNPGQYLLLADSFHGQSLWQIYVMNPNGTNWGVHLRHDNRANALFADGSVRALTRQELRTQTPIPITGGYTAEGAFTGF